MAQKEPRAMADRMTTSDVVGQSTPHNPTGGSSSSRGGTGSRGSAGSRDDIPDDTAAVTEAPPAPVPPVMVHSNPHVVEMLQKVDEIHQVALSLENSSELADVLYKAVMLKESVMQYDQAMKDAASHQTVE